MKTVKQIKNLKAYAKAEKTLVWTARMENGNWEWGWYDIKDFETNNSDYFHRLNEKLEYSIQ